MRLSTAEMGSARLRQDKSSTAFGRTAYERHRQELCKALSMIVGGIHSIRPVQVLVIAIALTLSPRSMVSETNIQWISLSAEQPFNPPEEPPRV